MYECKLNLTEYNIERVLIQIKNKIEKLKRKFKKEIKAILIVYNEVSPKIKDKLRRKNIEIVDGFENTLIIKKIKRILEQNIFSLPSY